MGVLAPRLRTLDGQLVPPSTRAEIFRRTCLGGGAHHWFCLHTFERCVLSNGVNSNGHVFSHIGSSTSLRWDWVRMITKTRIRVRMIIKTRIRVRIVIKTRIRVAINRRAVNLHVKNGN